MSISQCGYLVGKIIHSLVGLGDKNLCDSITSVLYSFSPDPWSPSLSCHLPCCQMQVQVQLSLIAPPLLGVQFYSPCSGSPLLWVRVSLQNHLPLCRGTQSLGDLCKADTPFSLSRPRHILHLLSASSTPVVADLPRLPTQLSLLSSLPFLSPRSRAAVPQTTLGVHSLASSICTGGP